MNNIQVELVQETELILNKWGDWNNDRALCKGYPSSDVAAKMAGAGGLPIAPLDDDTAMLINEALAPIKQGYYEAWQVAEAIWIDKLAMSHRRFPVSYSKATRIRPMLVGIVMGKLFPEGIPAKNV